MGEWVRSGALESRFDVAKGLKDMPRAFFRLLKSGNLGKQPVQVGSEPV
jgi:NADPH-dependent curcumin reductase CurA